jgi:hypothetical protein
MPCQTWVKKNILGATPFIGSFFTAHTTREAIHHEAHMFCEMSGGTIAMIVFMTKNMMPMDGDPDSTYREYYASMIGIMLVGMMLGKISFNIAYSVLEKTCLRPEQDEDGLQNDSHTMIRPI